MDEDRNSLEAQLREIYSRIVYTHKTHEVMADLYDKRNGCTKFWQVVLSALTASGIIGIIFSEAVWLPYVTAVVSLLNVFLTAYAKDINPEASAQKHRETAADMWNVREGYLSLLTDFIGLSVSTSDIRVRRDVLQNQLHTIYRSAPHTTRKAYKIAQTRLKKEEDMTLSNDEIDHFLPEALKYRG